MIFINCLRQYNEIHVITKPSSSKCQVCVSAVWGGGALSRYSMVSQSPAQVPVKYVSVQCGGGGAITVLYGTRTCTHYTVSSQSVDLSIIFTCLSIYLSIYLYLHVPTYLHIYLFNLGTMRGVVWYFAHKVGTQTTIYLLYLYMYVENSFCCQSIDKALVAIDLQPPSIVEDHGFQSFLKIIDPKYIPPSRWPIAPLCETTCLTLTAPCVITRFSSRYSKINFLHVPLFICSKEW